MSGSELGLFLRTRRAAVSPAEVGLPAGPRRRTPGLRRSEVAMLAGVSVEYVTRLEQGRDRHPSPQVLAALAGALRLTAAERVRLHRYVKAADSGFTCRDLGGPGREVRPELRLLLNQLEPAPAALVDGRGDVLAYTAGYRRLYEPVGLFDTDPPNLARHLFTDARARAAYPDWEHVADEQVAMLKHGPFRADPYLAALVDELTVTAGDAFTRRIAEIPGLARSHGVVRLVHPAVGELRLAYELLELSADDGLRLSVRLPADDATASALRRLDQRTGSLRLVAG